MSTVEKSIRLYAWKTNYQTFQVVQGESDSRTFNIQLFSTTIPVNLTACEVMFFAIKPDSTKVYVECEVVDAENGLARVTLTEQMCVVDGTVDCWVQVIGDGGADLRFEGMNIEVSPCPMTASIMSTDDMRAFLQMGAKLAAVETEVSNARAGKESLRDKQAAQDKALTDTAAAIRQEMTNADNTLQQNLNTQKSRIDTMASLPEGSTRGDAELADLRIPAEGFTVPEGANAGTAVRAQFSALKEDLMNVGDGIKEQIAIPYKKNELYSYGGYSEEIAKVSENERWIVAFSSYSKAISIRNLKNSWVDQSVIMNDNNICEINITKNGSLRINSETVYNGTYIAFNTTNNDALHDFVASNGINAYAVLYKVNTIIEDYFSKNQEKLTEQYVSSIDPLTNTDVFTEHSIENGSLNLRKYNDSLRKYQFDIDKNKKYIIVIDIDIKNAGETDINSFYTIEGIPIRYTNGNVATTCGILDTNNHYQSGSVVNFEYSIPQNTNKNIRIIGKFNPGNFEQTSVYWTIGLNRFRTNPNESNITTGISGTVLNCWVFEDVEYTNDELKKYVGARILTDDVIVKNVSHASYADKIHTFVEGKKIVTYGDSITANGGWQDYLKEYFGCTIVNKGIGGTTVANNGAGNYFCLQSRIDTIPQDTDVVIVMGGTNDCGQSIEIGDLTYSNGFDTTKFKGGLATTIRMIQNRCPNALIFVASLCGGRGNTAGENLDTPVYNSKNLTSYDYAKATKDVAEFFNIQYIPIFEECGINCWNRATYIADSVHPNDYGKKQLAKIFIKHLSSYLIS